MENRKPSLSVVTPTYNRGDLLKNCYQSLLRQTCCDFEWIVVDDGSTDDTRDVVASFESSRFPIQYVSKNNGGKHTALNASHPFVRGRYVLILDSDDTLTETAVSEALALWEQYEDNERIGMVTFLKGTAKDKPVCTVREYDVPVDPAGCRRIPVISTDCCEVVRAGLFCQFSFPEFEGEKFLAEGALWTRIGYSHKCVYHDSVIYLCEYLEGGLTKSGRALRIRNPRGGMYTSNLHTVMGANSARRIKNSLLYDCYGFFAGISPREMIKQCGAPVLSLLFIPPAYLLYRCWKKKYGGAKAEG